MARTDAGHTICFDSRLVDRASSTAPFNRTANTFLNHSYPWISLFLAGAAGIIWSQSLVPFQLFSEQPIHVGTAIIKQQELWAALISLLLFGLLSLYFRYNKMGVAMRATADDQKQCRHAVFLSPGYSHAPGCFPAS